MELQETQYILGSLLNGVMFLIRSIDGSANGDTFGRR